MIATVRPVPCRDLDIAYRFSDFTNGASRLSKSLYEAADAISPGIALLAERCKSVERWVDACVTPPQLVWRWHGFPTMHMADLLDAHPGLLIYCNEDDNDLARLIACGNVIGTVSGTAAEQADGSVTIAVWVSSFAYDDAGVQLDLFGAS